MNTLNETKHKERSIRFAEAGILFVLILAVAVFVGVKVTSRDSLDRTESPATVTAVTPTSPGESGTTTGNDLTRSRDTVLDTGSGVAASTGDLDQEPAPGEPSRTAGTVPSAKPPIITYAMAEAAYFEGRYDEAVEMFTAYANEHPDNAWGHYMLGLSCWKAGVPEAAEESLREALVLKPDHLKSLVNLSRVLLDLGRPAEALEFVEQAVALDREYADAYRVLGRVYHNLEQPQPAIEAYKEAIRRNDQDAWSLNNLGLLYIESADFGAALPPLARAVLLRQDVACFHNNLGMALERAGHNKAASAAYAKALNIEGDYEKAAVNLTRVEGREDAAGTAAIDLVALGEGFRIEPLLGATTLTDEMASAQQAADEQDADWSEDPTDQR